jgi:hypothetical protein
MDIKTLINKITKLTEDMFKEECNRYADFNALFPDIRRYYMQLMNLMSDLGQEGATNMNLLLEQMRNLSEAIEKRDSVLLYDTLYYEVRETLRLYQEVLEKVE